MTRPEIERMRLDQARAMPDTMRLLVPSRTEQPGGRTAEVWYVGAAIPYRFSPRRGSEPVVLGGRIIESADGVVTAPYGTSLPATYRLELRGVVYEIVYEADDHEWATASRAAVRRIG